MPLYLLKTKVKPVLTRFLLTNEFIRENKGKTITTKNILEGNNKQTNYNTQ